jgi:hypothetical protein
MVSMGQHSTDTIPDTALRLSPGFGWRIFLASILVSSVLTLYDDVAAKESSEASPAQWQIKGTRAALSDSHSEVLLELVQNESAGRALGEGLNPAIPNLTKLLEDPNPSVREAAAHALGTMGEAAKEAVPYLTKLLDEIFHSCHFGRIHCDQEAET